MPPLGPAARALILITCLAYGLALLAGPSTPVLLGLIPGRVTGALTLPGPPPILTFLTSLLMHGGWWHLAMNMVFLAFVARTVEAVLGPERFLGLYVAGGVVGGLAQVLSDPAAAYPVVGASGSISAILGAHALWFRPAGHKPGGRSERAEALRLAAGWLGVQLLFGFAFAGIGVGVAIWAHVGGFVAGLIYGLVILRRVRA